MSLDGSYDMILLPRRATTTMAADNPLVDGGIDDVFPARWKNNIRAHPALSPADGGGGGATKAKQEAAPRQLSSESTAPAPQRGARRASTSRLRRRRALSPRNTPIPSKWTTPARSQKACWASPSYLRRWCSQSLRFPSHAFWIRPRPAKRLCFGGRSRRGESEPSGVPYAVPLGPAGGRLDLRALGVRGR
jgi:hypothetical protein